MNGLFLFLGIKHNSIAVWLRYHVINSECRNFLWNVLFSLEIMSFQEGPLTSLERLKFYVDTKAPGL